MYFKVSVQKSLEELRIAAPIWKMLFAITRKHFNKQHLHEDPGIETTWKQYAENIQ